MRYHDVCPRCSGPISKDAKHQCKTCYLRYGTPEYCALRPENKGLPRVPPDLEAVERVRQRREAR